MLCASMGDTRLVRFVDGLMGARVRSFHFASFVLRRSLCLPDVAAGCHDTVR